MAAKRLKLSFTSLIGKNGAQKEEGDEVAAALEGLSKSGILSSIDRLQRKDHTSGYATAFKGPNIAEEDEKFVFQCQEQDSRLRMKKAGVQRSNSDVSVLTYISGGNEALTIGIKGGFVKRRSKRRARAHISTFGKSFHVAWNQDCVRVEHVQCKN